MARKEQPPKGLSLRGTETVRVVARPSKGATLPKYILTLGLYGFWRKRNTAVVTDRRILMGRGIINREERSIPLNRVNRASLSARGSGPTPRSTCWTGTATTPSGSALSPAGPPAAFRTS